MLHQAAARIPFLGSQRSMMDYETLYPDTTTYHRTVAVQLEGSVNEKILSEALVKITQSYEVLRARITDAMAFSIIDAEAVTKNFCQFDIINTEHTTLPPVVNLYQTLQDLNTASIVDGPFKFNQGPLWRAALVKSADGKSSQFLMIFHHIIVDENSIGIIFQRLSKEYNALLKGEILAPPTLPSLADCNFSIEQDKILKRSAYWQEKLQDLHTLALQTDYEPQKEFRFAGNRVYFEWDQVFVQQLIELGKQCSASLNAISLAALYALLHHYTSENDICLGITSSNRRYQHVPEEIAKQLPNCFFNSVPLRLVFDGETTFTSLLKKVSGNLRAALENQLPLEEVLRALTPETKSTLQTASPFNILLVYNTEKPTLTFEGTTASYPVELNLKRSKFPLFGINIDLQYDGSCVGFVEYNTDLFKETRINSLVGHLQKIFHHMIENPSSDIASVPLLLETEQRLIQDLNNTIQIKDDELSVPAYFQRIAHQFPEKIAVVFHGSGKKTTLTYAELEAYSNKIANYLEEQYGSLQGKVIGISLKRSTYLLAAMLAVLKMGAILLPLETDMSNQLLNKMEVASLDLLLVDQLTDSIFDTAILEMRFPTLKKISITESSTNSLIEKASADYTSAVDDLAAAAYIISTSGTTSGEQKALMLSHDGFSNLLYALSDEKIQPHSRVLCTSLVTFDAFLYDLLVAMVTAGELHLCFEDGRTDPLVLNEIIKNENINFAVLMPDLLAQLDPSLPFMHILLMGDIPNDPVLAAIKEKNPDVRIQVGFGLTEDTICNLLGEYMPENSKFIGFPIRNKQIYILNPATLALCPPGVPGEIYFGGRGLAKCFVNNPELTNKKFKIYQFNADSQRFCVPDPDQENLEQGIRLFASGDYGCYAFLPNGELSTQFIGRKDGQIKIHGLRINLNAVKKLLEDHPLIKEACVIVNPASSSTNKTLIAYIVRVENAENEPLSKESVRDYLVTSSLAKAGYPRDFVFLEKIPVTKNGKPDIRALPRPQATEPREVMQNLTVLQKQLLEGWQYVLGELQPSLNTFSELGGDSILFVRLKTYLSEISPPLYFNPAISVRVLIDMNIFSAEKYLLSELSYQLLTCWKTVLERNFDEINSEKSFLEQLSEKESASENLLVYQKKLLAQLKDKQIFLKKNSAPDAILGMTISDATLLLEIKHPKKISVPDIPLSFFNHSRELSRANQTLIPRPSPGSGNGG